VFALAAALISGGCRSTGACVVGNATDAGSTPGSYPHCDDGVSSDTCSSGGVPASFVDGKSCKDLGYTLSCSVVEPIAPPNCYVGGGGPPGDDGGAPDADAC
jgi:hypothetical protein